LGRALNAPVAATSDVNVLFLEPPLRSRVLLFRLERQIIQATAAAEQRMGVDAYITLQTTTRVTGNAKKVEK
jgi:hypothetical protein